MNQCIVIIGDFSKFGQQRGEGYNVYGVNLDTVLQKIQEVNPTANVITGLALRDAAPLYIPPDADFAADAKPVSYKVGQIECQPQPDSFVRRIGSWVGFDAYLSSLQYAPPKTMGIEIPNIPTYCYNLYHFDKYNSDLTASPTANLSAYDVLVRHKAPHPEGYENQCSAKLEYMSLSAIGAGNVQVDSE